MPATTIEPTLVILAVMLYATCFFCVAWISKRNLLPARLINNPLTYVLSLGVSINTWSFFKSIGIASERGYGYLAYYIGFSLAFLFAPVFLSPILRITKTYQLSSMADVFSFRFRSPLAGTLTTIVLLIAVVPLIALQIMEISTSAKLLLPQVNIHLLGFAFCFLALLFTLIFGASDHQGRDKHQGVVMALAFETVVKLIALMALGLCAVYGVFGGFGDLDRWLAATPATVTKLDVPFFGTSTNLVVLLFFAAAIATPHMFHMTFKENSNPDNLKIASWGLPLMLLAAAVPALPVFWAGRYLGSPYPAEFSGLAIGLIQQAPWLTLLVFIGGMAAAGGITIVVALALSNMCLNHLILPVHRPNPHVNLYDWLLLRRRILMAAIIAGCFLAFLPIADGSNSTDAGYASFIACVQFLPGILTLIYWPAGNRKGFIAGLLAGVGMWFLLGLLPLFTSVSVTSLSYSTPGQINWDLVASLSLVANIAALVAVSLLTRTSEEEKTAGRMCSMDAAHHPRRLELTAKTPMEFAQRLSHPLGAATARREVLHALKDLGLEENETRPYPIQQLRDQIEANLSGLLGPTIANQIVDSYLPYELVEDTAALDVNYLENRLEAYPGNLTGVAVDLDNLRRHHRRILQDLPLGVCSIGAGGEISLWNGAMARLTGTTGDRITGHGPAALPEPWKSLLLDFIQDEESTHLYKKAVRVDGRRRTLSLHKAVIEKNPDWENLGEGLVIVVEDLTETELLEEELAHAERLASIGRLAAGVAHEIGNPITGIACLAQNIRDETEAGDLNQMAQSILDQTKRASRIVHSLVSFSHSGAQHSDEEFKQAVSVRHCAEEAIQLISLNRKGRDIHIINGCDEEVLIHTDKQRLQQVFVNLLSNARDASQMGSTIFVTNSINDGRVSIMITDQGKGIPPEIQGRIFEPFFTTKKPGRGTGLGLALVYNITEDLGGTLRVESPVDKVRKKGTRVTVTFPCYRGKVLHGKVETA